MEETTNLPVENQQDVTPTEGDVVEEKKEETTAPVEEKDFAPFEEEEEKKPITGKDVDIDDDDRKVMQAVVQDENKGIVNEVQGLKVDIKVNTFLADDVNQVYRPYAEKIREYAQSPKAKGLKAEAIARLAVDPRDMMAKGAEEERKASKESRDSVSAGSTARAKEGSGKFADAWGMTPGKFKETIDKVKRNR